MLKRRRRDSNEFQWEVDSDDEDIMQMDMDDNDIDNSKSRPTSDCNSMVKLENICMRKGWKFPVLRVMKIETLSHAKLYTVVCLLEKMAVKTKGTSEMVARRDAANKMLKMANAMFEDLSYGQVNKLKTAAVEEKPNVLKIKRNPTETYKALSAASFLPTGLSALVFLQNISIENHFVLKFIEFQKNPNISEFDCILELSLQPVTVVVGKGATNQAARFNAAENALSYLKYSK